MAEYQRRLPGIRIPTEDPWALQLPRGWKFPRNFRTARPIPPEPLPFRQMGLPFENPPSPVDTSNIRLNEPRDLGRSISNIGSGISGEAENLFEKAAPKVSKLSRLSGILGKGIGAAGTASVLYPLLRETFPSNEEAKANYTLPPNYRGGNVVGTRGLYRQSNDAAPSSDYADSNTSDNTDYFSPLDSLSPLDASSTGPTVDNARKIKPSALGLRAKSPSVIGGMRKSKIPNINSMTGLSSDYLDNLDSIDNISVPKTTLDSRNVDLGNNLEPLPPADNAKTPTERTAMQRYMDLLNQFPDQKASKWLKLMAGLAGGSQAYFGNPAEGVKTARDIVEHPNDSAVADWKLQLDQLEPLARMESQQYIKNQDVQYKQGRDLLINQTKSVENDIRKLMADNKFITDSDRNEVNRAIAEAKQLTADGQLELAKQKLEEVRGYHKQLIDIGKTNAGSRAISATASQTRANKAGTTSTGGGSPLTQANQRARLQKQAKDMVEEEMYAESGAKSASDFFAAIYGNPERKAEYDKRIQNKITELMGGK